MLSTFLLSPGIIPAMIVVVLTIDLVLPRSFLLRIVEQVQVSRRFSTALPDCVRLSLPSMLVVLTQ